MNKTSRIYVAGHRGLIGSAIVRCLEARGFRSLITRSRHELDLARQRDVERFFERQKPEYVFLAAGKVGGIRANAASPADFIYENLLIQANCIQGAYRYGVKKLVLLASPCLYPRECRQPMRPEDILTGPLEETSEPFAVAKIAGIKLCQSYHRQYGAPFLTVIPANVYGVGDRMDEDGHVVAALIKKFHKARERSEKRIVIWGSGKPKRDFFYVDDAASASLFAMQRAPAGAIVNAGTGVETSIGELAGLLASISGFKGALVFDTNRPDGHRRRLLDSSWIRAAGWRPRVGLREGLSRMYAWYAASHFTEKGSRGRRDPQ